MQIEVRPLAGGAAEYARTVNVAFGGDFNEDEVAVFERAFEPDRAIGAYDGDRMIGGAGVFSMALTVPGGELPMAGVTAVGVLPTHRRRGVLTALMQRQLADIHARGEPLAGLWASEATIYGRFGYGMATFNLGVHADRRRTVFREPVRAGGVRLVDADEARALMPRVHEMVRPTRPGFFTRTPGFWEAEVFADLPGFRRGGTQQFHVVHERDGAPDGYARYRLQQDWDAAGPKSTLMVLEALGSDPPATAAIWSYLFGVDLVATVRARAQAIDTPLLWMVREPRGLGVTLGDGLWLRLVDLAAALRGRSYAGDGRIVLEVADQTCPWNEGRWALEASGSRGDVTRTRADAELAIGVDDLAALYLGGASAAELLAAGRLEELAHGAVARLDAMLRRDVAPWCPLIF